jgi:hypothetical protein
MKMAFSGASLIRFLRKVSIDDRHAFLHQPDPDVPDDIDELSHGQILLVSSEEGGAG